MLPFHRVTNRTVHFHGRRPRLNKSGLYELFLYPGLRVLVVSGVGGEPMSGLTLSSTTTPYFFSKLCHLPDCALENGLRSNSKRKIVAIHVPLRFHPCGRGIDLLVKACRSKSAAQRPTEKQKTACGGKAPAGKGPAFMVRALSTKDRRRLPWSDNHHAREHRQRVELLQVQQRSLAYRHTAKGGSSHCDIGMPTSLIYLARPAAVRRAIAKSW